jgi:hypothetical protein
MTRKSAQLLFLSAPVVAGALTLGLYYGRDYWLHPRTVFVDPRSIDQESRDRDETAILEIQNAARRERVVEREVDGESALVKSVQVPAAGAAELADRAAVGAPVGDRQGVQADPVGVGVPIPLVPEGIYAAPRAVVFGSVPVGERVRRVVEIYDAGALGCRVARVRSAQPDRFDVRLLALAAGEGGRAGGPEGKLVARLEVTAKTERPGQLDGDIEVDLTNEPRPPNRMPVTRTVGLFGLHGLSPSRRLPVTGEVVSAARCWPSVVVLPRRIGDRTVFRSEALVQGREEAPLQVRLLGAPAGLRVEIRPVAGHEEQRMVVVEGKPVAVSPRPASASCIRLGVRSGEHPEQMVEIPVLATEFAP